MGRTPTATVDDEIGRNERGKSKGKDFHLSLSPLSISFSSLFLSFAVALPRQELEEGRRGREGLMDVIETRPPYL
jgi:hypothetical protein